MYSRQAAGPGSAYWATARVSSPKRRESTTSISQRNRRLTATAGAQSRNEGDAWAAGWLIGLGRRHAIGFSEYTCTPASSATRLIGP